MTERILMDVFSGEITHEVGEARIACFTACTTAIFCNVCGKVLDAKKTTVMTVHAPNHGRGAAALCPECAKRHLDAVDNWVSGKDGVTVEFETWTGKEVFA